MLEAFKQTTTAKVLNIRPIPSIMEIVIKHRTDLGLGTDAAPRGRRQAHVENLLLVESCILEVGTY